MDWHCLMMTWWAGCLIKISRQPNWFSGSFLGENHSYPCKRAGRGQECRSRWTQHYPGCICNGWNGQEMDIEVQGNSEGAHIRRARYHSSVLDSKMLKEGQPFKNWRIPMWSLFTGTISSKRFTGIPYRPICKRDRGNLRGRITYRICKREL